MNAKRIAAPRATAPTVLVVEDEVLIRLATADALRESGFLVIEAGAAAEALDYIKSGAPIDLVFADIEMPGTMNGFGLARLLRAEFPKLKVILTSGGLRTPDIVAAGPFVQKPYDLSQVISGIRALLAEPGDD